nr:hypothetical protein [Tanacetum cinerariifolium]
KNNCPKLGNRNQGNKNQGNQNQAGNGNVVARAYEVGTGGGNPDANVVTGSPPTYLSISSDSSENILPHNRANSWKRRV